MPVIVTVKNPLLSPLDPWKVRVAVPDPPADNVIVAGLNASVTPETELAERVIVPANPLRLVTVIVVEVEPSLDIETLVGEALMLKSPAAGAVTVNA